MASQISPTKAVALAFGVASAALATAGLAAAATPVAGSVFGPVTAVKGTTFTVKTTVSPTGASTVAVSSATAIVQEAAGKRGDLRNGVCVVATGQKDSKGTVAATRITVSQPVGGKCAAGFGGGTGGPRSGVRPGNGAPPTGAQRPPGGLAGFGFAAGAIASVKGSTLAVRGQTGTTNVTVSAKTQILARRTVRSTAIAVKSCAFVRGTSADGGRTVVAQSVNLAQPTAAGCAAPGFRRR